MWKISQRCSEIVSVSVTLIQTYCFALKIMKNWALAFHAAGALCNGSTRMEEDKGLTLSLDWRKEQKSLDQQPPKHMDHVRRQFQQRCLSFGLSGS